MAVGSRPAAKHIYILPLSSTLPLDPIRESGYHFGPC